jgi:Tol biopolymer transport system component
MRTLLPKRFPRLRARVRAAAVLVAALAGVSAGCGKNDNQVSTTPDCEGLYLLVFASDRGHAAGDTRIFLYDVDANGFRAIPNLDAAGPEREPALGTDRRTIAFVADRAGTGDDVLFYDRCLDRLVPVPQTAGPGNESEPAFSGDGTRLAFVRDTLGHRRIRLFEGQNGAYLPLHLLDSLAAQGAYDDWQPSIDQTGRLIAFTSNRGGNEDVWVYDRATDTLLDLPDLRSSGHDVDPWITRSGRYVGFASDRAAGQGGYDVYVYDLQTHTFFDLTGLNSAANDRNPSLSPDLTLIVFESDRTGAGAHGAVDLWDYNPSTHVVSQFAEQSSSGNDLQPYLAWP